MMLTNLIQNEQRHKIFNGVKIIEGSEGFSFGNCACKAISEAFNMSVGTCVFTCKLLDLDYEDGLTFKECKFLIDEFASISYKNVYYKANKEKMSLIDFCKKNKQGTFILNTPGHLSLLRNGIIVDTLYFQNPWIINKLLGFWEIKPLSYC